jgi:hypothetical protein
MTEFLIITSISPPAGVSTFEVDGPNVRYLGSGMLKLLTVTMKI